MAFVALYMAALYAQATAFASADVVGALRRALLDDPARPSLRFASGAQALAYLGNRVVRAAWTDPVCGDGRCEAPWEFPSWGPFGCRADCGADPRARPVVVVVTGDFAGHRTLGARALMATAAWNLCLDDAARRARGEADLCWCVVFSRLFGAGGCACSGRAAPRSRHGGADHRKREKSHSKQTTKKQTARSPLPPPNAAKKHRFEADQTFSQAQETQIRTVSLVEGSWYVRVRGDYAGRVTGAVYNAAEAEAAAAVDAGVEEGGGGAANGTSPQLPTPIKVEVGATDRERERGRGTGPPALENKTTRTTNKHTRPSHTTNKYTQPAWDSCKTRRSASSAASASAVAVAGRRLRSALDRLRQAAGRDGANAILRRALLEASEESA